MGDVARTYRDGSEWEERAKEDGIGCHQEEERGKSDGEVGCIEGRHVFGWLEERVQVQRS